MGFVRGPSAEALEGGRAANAAASVSVGSSRLAPLWPLRFKSSGCWFEPGVAPRVPLGVSYSVGFLWFKPSKGEEEECGCRQCDVQLKDVWGDMKIKPPDPVLVTPHPSAALTGSGFNFFGCFGFFFSWLGAVGVCRLSAPPASQSDQCSARGGSAVEVHVEPPRSLSSLCDLTLPSLLKLLPDASFTDFRRARGGDKRGLGNL